MAAASPDSRSTRRAKSRASDRSAAARAAADRSAVIASMSGPISSAASSSSGTSEMVQGAPGSRSTNCWCAGLITPPPASASLAGLQSRSLINPLAVNGIQHRFTSRRTSRESRNSASRAPRSSSWACIRRRSASWSARSSSTIRTNVVRASLCGRPDWRARARASLTTRGRRAISSPSIIRRTGSVSSRCRRRTAALTTEAIRSPPLITATSSRSRAEASTPGNSCPGVTRTTPVSPSEGSTCSMYCRNTVVGPITKTPLRAIRSRWV